MARGGFANRLNDTVAMPATMTCATSISNSDLLSDPALVKSASGHDICAVGEGEDPKPDSDSSESKIATVMLDSFESDAVICGPCHVISAGVREEN